MKMKLVIIMAGVGIAALAHGQAFQLTPSDPSAPYQYQPYSQYLTPDGPISSNPNAASATDRISSEFIEMDPLEKYKTDIKRTQTCGPQGNGDYILCESTGGIINRTQKNFPAFLRQMYNLAFILAGTVAFVRIVYGGILYSWSGVIDRKKEAIGIFKNVAYGMALLMGSYAVLNTINPALTILALPDVTMKTPQEPSEPKNDPRKLQPYSVTDETISRWEQEERETLSTIELIQDRMQLLETTTPNRTPEQKSELESLRNQLQQNEKKVKSLQDGIKEGTYAP